MNCELTSNTDLSLHPPPPVTSLSLSLTSRIYILLLSLSLYKYYIIHTKLNSLCMMYNLMVSSPPPHTHLERSLSHSSCILAQSPSPLPPHALLSSFKLSLLLASRFPLLCYSVCISMPPSPIVELTSIRRCVSRRQTAVVSARFSRERRVPRFFVTRLT